ncbi:hypothetical protein ACI2IY_05800 [Lysobacter enzymogenes]|uniref:hypothetical protein n=1 Tax=Lysobacter enzymogenes TaxID=69 RepID=UPI00384BD1AF
MLDNETLAKRIQLAIDESAHSQASIAAAFGITEQAVSGWIRTGKFDKRKAPKLAQLTGRPVEFFLEEAYPSQASQQPSQPGRPDLATLHRAMRLLSFVSQLQAAPIDFSEDADALLAAYDLVARRPSDFNLEDASKRMSEWLRARGGDGRMDRRDVVGAGGKAVGED